MLASRAFILATLLAASPLAAAIAAPTDPTSAGAGGRDSGKHKGWEIACSKSPTQGPCKHGPLVVPTTHVGPGEERRYEGKTYRAEGTVTVEGRVVVENATFEFADSSRGFIVKPGGSLRVTSSRFLPAADALEPQWGVDAEPGSTLVVTGTRMVEGRGVHTRTDATTFHTNTLERMARALFLEGATVDIHHNTFVENGVGINATGGAPTMQWNTFQGTRDCIRDWRTNPVIHNNTMLGCIFGIWHEESHSAIKDNTIIEDGDPISRGIVVVNGDSPTIERNVITNFAIGIHLMNARAFIRNNTIHNNTLHAILIQDNRNPMDVQGNRIVDNGGSGLRIEGGVAIDVVGNVIERNGGTAAADAVVVVDSEPGLDFSANRVAHNARRGFHVLGTPDLVLTANEVASNGNHGIELTGSPAARFTENVVTSNGRAGIVIASDEARLTGDVVNGNIEDGIYLPHARAAWITSVDTNANGFTGIIIVGGGDHVLHDVNASGNGRIGFYVDPAGSSSGPNVFSFARALGNEHGLVNVQGNATIARDSWFEGNTQSGAWNLDGATRPDVRDSYWGHPSGPTHAENPSGTGDVILGSFLFSPHASSPPTPPPPCTVACF